MGPRTEGRALDDIAEKLADGTNFKVFGCRLVDPRFVYICGLRCSYTDYKFNKVE